MVTRLTKYGAEALVFVVILTGVYAYQARNLLPADARLAPALSGPTLNGASFDLHEDAATATLVYFFAPWCKICAASSSNIKMLRKIRDEQDLRVLMVALDWQTITEVQDYVDRHEIAVLVVLGNRKTAGDWNIYAFPTYYILNSEQQVIRRDLGYSTLAGLWWRSLLLD